MRALLDSEETHIPSLLLPKGDLKSVFLKKSEKTSHTPEKSDVPDLTLLPELSSWTTSGAILRIINLMQPLSALRGTLGAAGHT